MALEYRFLCDFRVWFFIVMLSFLLIFFFWLRLGFRGDKGCLEDFLGISYWVGVFGFFF